MKRKTPNLRGLGIAIQAPLKPQYKHSVMTLSGTAPIISFPASAGRAPFSLSLKGNTLKNELNYNPTTWAEWTKTNVTGDGVGLEFTNPASGDASVAIATQIKASTKYGLLYNIVSSTLTTDYFGISSASAFPQTILSKTVGNVRHVITSNATISTNRLFMYIDGSTGVDGNKIKIKDIRIFELPAGSEIETDFNTLTADQLAVKYPYINGNIAPNLVINGNFANGTTGWGVVGATISTTSNEATLTSTTQYGRLKKADPIPNIIAGRKYYYFAEVKSNSNQIEIQPIAIKHSGSNQYERLTGIYTRATDLINSEFAFNIRDTRTSGWTPFYVKNTGIIDLTANGLESLTKAELDLLFATYNPSGSKRTMPVKVKSVGKNLFDGQLELGDFSWAGEKINASDRIRNVNFVRVKPNTSYTISGGTSSGYQLNSYDINKLATAWATQNGLSVSYAISTFTTPTNCYYLKFVARATIDTNAHIQLEEGSTSTAYEPYTETSVTLPEVGKSLPNGVKDEIVVSGGTMKKVQRTATKVLQASDITNLITTGTNVDYAWAPINILVGSVAFTGYADTTKRSYVSDYTETVLPVDDVTKKGMYIVGASYIVFIFAKGTYANLAAAQAALAGKVLTYQLATPVTTDLGTITELISNPSGSIIVEPATVAAADTSLPTVSATYITKTAR